jgi:hypothetical protein
MKRIALTLMMLGWLCYTLSFFLPWFRFFGVVRGWSAMSELMFTLSRDVGMYTVLLWASTIAMLSTPLALWSHELRLRRVLLWLVLLVTLFNLAVFASYALDVFRHMLVGYFLWCAAFVLVTCGLVLNLRAQRSAFAH